jgi:hypothetical protein
MPLRDEEMQEHEFFRSENVLVSQTRFVTFGQTYAMSGVTSVKASSVSPSRTAPLVIGGIGVLCLFGGSTGVLVFGVALLAIAALIWASQKPEYFVSLSVASGEVRALKSRDPQFVNNVIQALNDCIIARG